MVTQDYKETVLHKLEKAGGCGEVEEIISLYMEQYPEEDLYRFLIIIYLRILQNDLEKISELHVDFDKRFNIRHALYYLNQMNTNCSKAE